MKGVSEIILVILILLIAISMTAVLFIWVNQTTFNIYPEESQQTAYLRQKACLGIENIGSSQVTIKNCGATMLEDFKVYVDGSLQTVTVPNKLYPGNVSAITVTIPENSKVFVTSNYAQSPAIRYIVNPVCPNGIIEGDETCDTTDFGGKTCESELGQYYAGNLICSADCNTIETTGCIPPIFVCKDGTCNTTSIKDAIYNLALPGANVIVKDTGTYVEGKIDINQDLKGLTLDCNGAILQAPTDKDRKYAIKLQDQSENMTIQNCVMIGYEDEAIRFNKGTYNTIENNVITNTIRGIQMGDSNNNIISSNVFSGITDCAIYNCEDTTCSGDDPNPGTSCTNTITGNAPSNCC